MSAGENDDLYLVWSNERQRWWGPNESGYVQSLEAAGRYTRREVISICRQSIVGTAKSIGMFPELPVRVRDVRDFIAGQLIPEELL